jgi:hypothetical protein
MLAGVFHAFANTSGNEQIAAFLAPRYQRPTEPEAQELLASYAKNLREWQSDYRSRCEDNRLSILDSWLEKCLQDGQDVLANASEPTLADAYEQHANLHRSKEIEPRKEMLRETVIPWTFGIIYTALIIGTLVVLLSWFSRSIAPIAKSKLLQTYATLSRALGNARRPTIDRIAMELSNLKALHEGGLLSDEEFKVRMSELKAAASEAVGTSYGVTRSKRD